MAFIGNTPTTQAFTPAIDYFSGDGTTVAFTLSRPVASVAQVQVVVNNVPQNPSTAYTVSSNTITFSGAPSSGTNNIYVEYTSPITQVQGLTQAPSVIGPMAVAVNGAASLSGATNPVVAMNGNVNNYIQSYTYNRSAGASASADFTAYPDNGADASGWVDMGITSSGYSSATYSVTGANESYLFGSAPSGAGKTGNLVIATDSTGSANSIQFYIGGFAQSKSAYTAQLTTTGLQLGTGKVLTFPDATTQSTAASTTSTTFGAVGTYVIAGASGLTASTAYAAGTTVAGSTLYYDNTGGGTYGAPLASQGYNAITVGTPISYGLSGTWRLMCRIGQGSNTGYYPTALWLRIS